MKKVLAIGIVAILLLLLVTSVSATWCNNDYGKKAPILINNTAGSVQTYYQVELNYTHDSDMNSNFSDILVYNESDCSLVPLWNESAVASSWNKIWINFSDIPASSWTNNTYYLYYNYSANSVSNITNTFLFGDEFDDFSETIVGSCGNWASERNIAIQGNYGYVGTSTGLKSINITNKSNPTSMDSVISDNVLEVIASGNYVYVTNGYGGGPNTVKIVNISDPSNMVVVGDVENNTQLNGCHGGYLYEFFFYVCAFDGDRLTIVNVTNKTNPAITGSLYNTTYLNGSHDVTVQGNYAYVSSHYSNEANKGAFAIIDISDKSNPSIVSYIIDEKLYSGAGAEINGNYFYMGSDPPGEAEYIVVINITDINNPAMVNNVSGNQMYTGSLQGTKLWIASCGKGDVVRYDVSDASNPVKEEEYSFASSQYAMDVFVDGDYLYTTQRETTDSFFIMNKLWVNETKWHTISGTFSVSSGKLQLDDSTCIRSDSFQIEDSVITAKITLAADRRVVMGTGYGADLTHGAYMMYDIDSDRWYLRTPAGQTNYDVDPTLDTTEHEWKQTISNNEIKSYCDEIHIASKSDATITDDYVLLRHWGAGGGTTTVDFIHVRKYATPEPTASLGTEEDAPAGDTYIPPDPTNLQHTDGNFWVNYTWDAGSGNVTNGYNVSWNGTWDNTTTPFFDGGNALTDRATGAGNGYTVIEKANAISASGTIKEWQVYGVASETNTVKLKVFRDNGTHWIYVSESSLETVVAGLNKFTTSIDVQSGDYIGFYTNSGSNVVEQGASGGSISYWATDVASDSPHGSWSTGSHIHSIYAYGGADFMNKSVGASGWANITVYAWNSSGSGTLSAGSVSDQVQVSAADTTFTVSLPVGYTKPVFQPPNSTATNYPPNGQTDSQEFFNVTNSGNVNLDVRMRLNTTVSTITLKADADNNPTGADTIGTSLVTIHSNLGQGSSVGVWLWSDFDHTVAQTANRTIYINVSQS